MDREEFHIGGVMSPERGEIETVRFLAAKLSCLDACLDKKVVRWCETQTSSYYAQDIANPLVTAK